MSDRRRLLEVLKWTPAEDILYSTSLVSRQWLEASENDEVWISLSHDYGSFPYRPENQSYKEGFRRQTTTLLPVLRTTSLRMFHCHSKTVVKEITFRGTLYDEYQIAAVLLPDGRLIACGGQSSSQVLSVLPSGKFEPLQSMRARRTFHSLALLPSTLYVFGGDGNTNRSAEKLRIEGLDSLPEREWEALPDSLLPHSACQPCMRCPLVYLCGGNVNQCEEFDTVSEEYMLLPFLLPEGKFGCVSFFRKGELIIFTQNFVSRWKPGGEIQSKRNVENCSGIWTSMKQVLIGSFLFSAEMGNIRVFDLEKGHRRTELAFN